MRESSNLTTLCYIEKNGHYLMMHRTKKEQDINEGKWIGVGGHFLENESPEECLVREVKEETGYELKDYRFRGIVTFIADDAESEYMHLYTGEITGEALPDVITCDEGELAWIEKTKVMELNLWEGDKIFLELLLKEQHFFSLKLVYEKGALIDAQTKIYQ